jgi:hypothetical protein
MGITSNPFGGVLEVLLGRDVVSVLGITSKPTDGYRRVSKLCSGS